MKRKIRIALLLIVLASGIAIFPRVQAVETKNSTQQEPIKNKNLRNFRGIRIYPNFVEELLFSYSKAKTVETEADAPLSGHHDRLNDNGNRVEMQFPKQCHSKNNCNKPMTTKKR